MKKENRTTQPQAATAGPENPAVLESIKFPVMQTTSYRIALNKPGADNRKAYASKLLASYKWTEQQRDLLIQMSEKGYFIGKYNDAAKAFGLNPVTNGEKRCLMVYGYYSDKPENKKQQITIL